MEEVDESGPMAWETAEDYEARQLAALHYVDRQTAPSEPSTPSRPAQVSRRFPVKSKARQRYWSKSVPELAPALPPPPSLPSLPSLPPPPPPKIGPLTPVKSKRAARKQRILERKRRNFPPRIRFELADHEDQFDRYESFATNYLQNVARRNAHSLYTPFDDDPPPGTTPDPKKDAPSQKSDGVEPNASADGNPPPAKNAPPAPSNPPIPSTAKHDSPFVGDSPPAPQKPPISTPKSAFASVNNAPPKIAPTNATKSAQEIQKVPPVIVVDSSDDDDDSVIVVPIPEETAIDVECSDDESAARKDGRPEDAESKSAANDKNRASPVPSAVSSNSDDFIQQDCRRLDLLRDYPADSELHFELHGENLNMSNAHQPALKTGVISTVSSSPAPQKKPSSPASSEPPNEVFATPENKKKKSTPKSKTYTVPDTGTPMTFIDVYDSESSDFPESVVDVPITNAAPLAKVNNKAKNKLPDKPDDLFINITSNEVQSEPSTETMSHIVNEDDVSRAIKILDPNANIEKTTFDKCIEDMKAFYDNSWGGENFEIVQIKKNMPASKDHWAIDIADKFDNNRRKYINKCRDCNKFGHREDRCPHRPKICYMCGQNGHLEPKCPNKLCLNCGNPNNSYSTQCRRCVSWRKIKCKICLLNGHPKENCPDLWRRYHLTITNEIPLIENKAIKPVGDLYCAACGRKGHLPFGCDTHRSRCFPSFPYICDYTPIYVPDGIRKLQPIQETIENNCIEGPSKISSPKLKRQLDLNESKNNSLTQENVSPSVSTQSFVKTPERNHAKKIKLNDDSESQLLNKPEVEIVEIGDSDVENENIDFLNLYLSQKKINVFLTSEGNQFLKYVSQKHAVTLKIFPRTYSLKIFFGNHQKLGILNELKNWLYLRDSHTHFIPINKQEAVKKLTKGLEMLDQHIGIPSRIYKSIKENERKLTNMEKYNSKDKRVILTLINNVKTAYRKLNMILLGQAGLKNGKENLTQLQHAIKSLRVDQSINKCKTLSISERHLLNKLYLNIFSDYPLHDYGKLIKQFHSILHRVPKKR